MPPSRTRPACRGPRRPRSAAPLAAAVLAGAASACWRPVDGPADPDAPQAPTIAVDPLADAVVDRLQAPLTLYWPRGPGRPCEAWRYTPAAADADGGAPARLELGGDDEGATRLAFRATLRDRALFLTAPTHARDGRSTALPCAYAGQLLRQGARVVGLELGSDAGLHLDADACAAGRAPPIRPLGCPEALADPSTRARLDALAAAAARDAPEPAAAAEPARWPGGRVVYLRIAGDEGPTCARWRVYPATRAAAGGPRFGVLRRRAGDVSQTVDYQIDGDWLTLASPTAARREGDLAVRRTRSCLVSLEALARDRRSVAFEALSWHRSRRACEADRDPLAAPPPCLRALAAPVPGDDR